MTNIFSFLNKKAGVALIVGVMVAVASFGAQVFAYEQTYTNTFDDQNALSDWYGVSGTPMTWTVSAGTLRPQYNTLTAVYGAGTPSVTEFTATYDAVDVGAYNNNFGGLVFGYANNHGFAFGENKYTNKWTIAEFNGTSIVKQYTFNASVNASSTVRVVVDENNTATFGYVLPGGSVNTIGSVPLPASYTGGQFGFWSKSNTYRFDNLSVTYNDTTYPTSYPTVTKLSLASNTLNNGASVPLFKFAVSADSQDLGFYKASFNVATTNVSVTNFELIENPGTPNEVNLTNSGPATCDEPSVDGCVVNVLFDTGTDGTESGGEFRFIPGSTTKTYELRADVSYATSTSVIQTRLLSDTAVDYAEPVSAGTIDAGMNNNFIWSDLHYGNSSSTATNTLEWYNGYDVFVTTTAETLTK